MSLPWDKDETEIDERLETLRRYFLGSFCGPDQPEWDSLNVLSTPPMGEINCVAYLSNFSINTLDDGKDCGYSEREGDVEVQCLIDGLEEK